MLVEIDGVPNDSIPVAGVVVPNDSGPKLHPVPVFCAPNPKLVVVVVVVGVPKLNFDMMLG